MPDQLLYGLCSPGQTRQRPTLSDLRAQGAIAGSGQSDPAVLVSYSAFFPVSGPSHAVVVYSGADSIEHAGISFIVRDVDTAGDLHRISQICFCCAGGYGAWPPQAKTDYRQCGIG